MLNNMKNFTNQESDIKDFQELQLKIYEGLNENDKKEVHSLAAN